MECFSSEELLTAAGIFEEKADFAPTGEFVLSLKMDSMARLVKLKVKLNFCHNWEPYLRFEVLIYWIQFKLNIHRVVRGKFGNSSIMKNSDGIDPEL